MFGANTYFPVTVFLDYDPAADDIIPIWRAPFPCTIRSAYATIVNDMAAGTANYFSLALRNGGSAGTATTAIAAAVGGTAGWTNNTPRVFTIAAGDLAAGDIVQLDYDETGTGTFTAIAVQLDVQPGI